MASSSYSSLSILSPWRFRSHKKPFQIEEDHYFILSHLSFAVPSRFPPALSASRRYPNNNNYSHKEAVVVVPDPRAWVGDFGADEDGSGFDDDDNEEDDEDDRSLDLLARFLQNMFKKISRQARKSVRSVLPSSISTKLVRFSVNGVLILAFLWILKALLELPVIKLFHPASLMNHRTQPHHINVGVRFEESANFPQVVCTVGSMVFVSILLVRGILSGISYMKENQFNYMNRLEKTSNYNNAWDGVQPVA